MTRSNSAPTLRILVVEDEPKLAAQVIEMLSHLGYTHVDHCTSGEDAIQAVQQSSHDLVLMDIMLGGGMDGIEAASFIWEVTETPIVFLTAMDDLDTLMRSKMASPYGYITKPATESQLRATMEIAMSRHHIQKQSKLLAQHAQSILDAIPYPIVATDKNGAVLYLNVEAVNWVPGTSRSDIGRPVEQVLVLNSPSHSEVLKVAIRRSLEKSGAIRLPKRTMAKTDRGYKAIEGLVVPLDGPAIGTVIVVHEINPETVDPFGLETAAFDIREKLSAPGD